MVSELVKGLTLRGHEVVLFATGDSRPPCTLRSLYETAVWPPNPYAELAHCSWVVEEIRESEKPFDLIHAHSPSFLAFSRFLPEVPLVYTLHHERSEAQTAYYRMQGSGVDFVAISERQASLHKELETTVIHHGLDPTLYPSGEGKGGFLAFLGRLSYVKGPDTAILVAGLVGKELRLGGGRHEIDGEFFETVVEPLCQQNHVRLLGELSHEPKVQLLAEAEALLFPIRWEEPFGLAMIEAMLCGCPVVAFAGGAVNEVVEEGITGFIARDAEDMARIVREKVPGLDRARIRTRAQERFSCHRMVDKHLDLYRKAVEARAKPEIGVVFG